MNQDDAMKASAGWKTNLAQAPRNQPNSDMLAKAADMVGSIAAAADLRSNSVALAAQAAALQLRLPGPVRWSLRLFSGFELGNLFGRREGGFARKARVLQRGAVLDKA
jgi:hypothetical protein